ncbi:MAG: GNAT family N-acetyltransferase [Caulobacteraceae bacterium]
MPSLPLLRLADRLTDGVVLLDAHTLEDAQAHLAGADEEIRLRFDEGRTASLEETRGALARWIAARATGGPMFAYALRSPEGTLMGGCEIRLVEEGLANISYWVFPDFRRRGLGVRAVRLLIEAARGVQGLRRIEAHVAPDNLASRRLAQALGLREAGAVEETSWSGSVSTMIRYVAELSPAPGFGTASDGGPSPR